MFETCFVTEKSCRKKFFQKLKFLPCGDPLPWDPIGDPNGVEKFFCVFPALINVKLCETYFLSKKSCRKFFSKIEIYTLYSELVKIFEK